MSQEIGLETSKKEDITKETHAENNYSCPCNYPGCHNFKYVWHFIGWISLNIICMIWSIIYIMMLAKYNYNDLTTCYDQYLIIEPENPDNYKPYSLKKFNAFYSIIIINLLYTLLITASLLLIFKYNLINKIDKINRRCLITIVIVCILQFVFLCFAPFYALRHWELTWNNICIFEIYKIKIERIIMYIGIGFQYASLIGDILYVFFVIVNFMYNG